MSNLTKDNFKKTKKKIVRDKIGTSNDVSIVTLKYNYGDHNAGSEWLLKSNQFDWIVNEYVSSKLYSWALGSDAVAVNLLVADPANPKKLLLATKSFKGNKSNNFTPFNTETLKAGKVSFECLIKTCYTKLASNEKEVPIIGYEKSLIVSGLFDEGDGNYLNNYALLETKNKAIITRFDFDDSFKFFHLNGITRGMREESLGEEIRIEIAKRGLTVDYALNGMNAGVDNLKFGWHYLLNRMGDGLMVKILPSLISNPSKFINEFKELLDLDQGQLPVIISEAFAEAAEIVGEDIFADYYNIKKLDKLNGDKDTSKTNSEKLASYATKIVTSNFKEMESMLACLEVESAIKDNDLDLLKTILSPEINYSNLECSSYFMLTKHVARSKHHNKFEISHFDSIYHNEASKYLLGHIHSSDQDL